MSWDRIESSWQEAIWERLDLDLRERSLPWPVEAVYGYLRHAERQFRVRGEATPRDPGPRYWTPKGLPAQVVADAKRHLPGRRALRLITGLEERECRRLLASFYDWLDPRSVEEDEKAQRAPDPAGLRLTCPASPESRPPLPESRPSDAPATQVGPSTASQVPAQDDKFREIRPDRASISARGQQEQVQDHDPVEEGPGALERKQPATPTAEPAGPAFTLVPPNSAPPAKKMPKAMPPPKAPEPPPPEDWSEDEAALADLHEAIWREAMDVPRHKLKRFKNWADDRRWFRDTIIAEFDEDVSIRDELLKMQLWVRREIEAAISGRGHRVPRDHAQFMLNWFTRARSNPRHTDRDRDAAYRGVPDGYKPMRMDSNVNYGPRQHNELTEAERAELDRLPF